MRGFRRNHAFFVDIAADDIFVWTLHFTVKDDARGTIINVSNLALIPDDPDKPEFEVPSNEVPHIPVPIVKTSPTNTYRPGEDIRYDITVRLPTDLDGYNSMRIVDFYDNKLENPVSVSLTRNGVAVDANEMVKGDGTVSLLIEDIASEDVFVWTLRFTAKKDAEGVIINTSKLILMSDDPEKPDVEIPSNEVIHTPFEPPRIIKDSPTNTYRPGQVIRYNIEVTLPECIADYGQLRFEDIFDNMLENPRFISLTRNGELVEGLADMVIGDGIVSQLVTEFAAEDVFVWTLEFNAKRDAFGVIVNVARVVVIPSNPDDPEVPFDSNEVLHVPPKDFIYKHNAQFIDEPVAGAIIHIFNANGDMIFETESDAYGMAWFDILPAGNYTFQEVVAPEGFHLNSYVYSFTVNADGSISTTDPNLPHGALYLPNIPEELELLKIDGSENGLKGAEIEILDVNNERIELMVSDENGRMRVSLTELGIYRFREINAPDGYVLDETIYTFELRDDGRIDGKLTLVNHREDTRRTPTPPQTGVDSTRTILIAALVLLVLTGATIPTVMYRKEIIGKLMGKRNTIDISERFRK